MQTRIRQITTDSLCCEPILRRTPGGDLLCVAQIGDVTEPAPGNRVYFFRSSDNGDTWSKRELIRPEDGTAVYLTEVSVIGKKIIVYLTLHNGNFADWRSDRAVSDDDGFTWRSIGPLKGYETYTFPRGMIRLRDGTLCMACQYYPIGPEENRRLSENGLKVWQTETCACVRNDLLFSRDEGETWTAFPGPVLPLIREGKRKWVWSEPTVLELADGDIAMLLRFCGTGSLYRSTFHRDTKNFDEALPTDIPNPANKPKLLRMEDGRIALLHTPCAVQGFAGRNPLSVWFSKDEMKTFSDRHVISDFPGAFCYPDGVAEGEHILFSIEHNRHTVLFFDVDTGGEKT